MHIASTLNPLTKSMSDIPVLVLALCNSPGTIVSRKFIARPTHYADLVSVTRRTFNLTAGTRPIFGTVSLDVCRGQMIEIEESAYATILTFLDEVIVTVTVDAVAEDESAALVGDGGNGVDARHDSFAHGLAAEKRQGKAREIDAGEDVEEQPIAEVRTERSKRKRADELDRDVASTLREKLARSTPKAQHKPFKPEEPVPIPAAPKMRLQQPQPTPQPQPKEEVDLPVFDEEPDFDEEPGYDVHEKARHEDAQVAEGSVGIAGAKNDQDDWCFSAKGPAPGPSSSPAKGSQTKTLPAEADKATKASVNARTKEKALRARISDIGAAQLPSASSRPSLNGVPPAVASRSLEDARFTVTIQGPDEDQAAEFKTRGKHSVQKVLASVCKTFEVDFERSRLVLLVEVDGEDKAYYCHPDATMEMCGVFPDSRLLLQIEGEAVDFGNEEDEED